jgi:hypothetical protein
LNLVTGNDHHRRHDQLAFQDIDHPGGSHHCRLLGRERYGKER